MSATACYPGSFDPLTRGHLDLIQRSLGLFDRLIVAIGVNADKSPLFSAEDRVSMARAALVLLLLQLFAAAVWAQDFIDDRRIRREIGRQVTKLIDSKQFVGGGELFAQLERRSCRAQLPPPSKLKARGSESEPYSAIFR